MNMLNAASEPASFWAMLISGLVAFVSPCVLPMLPVYAAYLMSGTGDGRGRLLLLRRAAGLMCGFITFFVLLGASAGAIGSLLKGLNRGTLNIISGALMILFGIWMLDILPLRALGLPTGFGGSVKMSGFGGSLVFGILLAISWTPCMTPLLANALTLAAASATLWTGVWMLCVFALGLCLPMLAALLMYQWLKRGLGWLRSKQTIIRRLGGALMIGYGVYLIISTVA